MLRRRIFHGRARKDRYSKAGRRSGPPRRPRCPNHGLGSYLFRQPVMGGFRLRTFPQHGDDQNAERQTQVQNAVVGLACGDEADGSKQKNGDQEKAAAPTGLRGGGATPRPDNPG
jgi:hypothetical protein